MKVYFSGESQRRGFDLFEMGDEEFFEFVDNHPYPELMGGFLKKKIQKGVKKAKAKVQKAVKKAAAKYKKLPKWAKIVTGVLGAPAVLGLAPAAIGAVAPIAAGAAGLALTTAATAAPAALPLLHAKKMAQKIAQRRKAQLAAQKANVQPVEVVQAAPVQQEPVYSPQPAYSPEPAYSTQPQYDYEEQEPVTSSNAQPEKKGLPGWLLGAAALLPFFL